MAASSRCRMRVEQRQEIVERGGDTLSAAVLKPSNLASRIRDDDRCAEAELVERYARGLRLMLLKRTGSVQLANDLCQDTLVLALRKLRSGELKDPRCLSGFIRQIAINLTIEHFRRERRYILQDNGTISINHPHLEDKASGIDQQTARAALDRALEQLAMPRDREILRRFYLHDEDKVNICTELQLSASHFDRVLYRARQRMRDLINQQDGLRALLFGAVCDV